MLWWTLRKLKRQLKSGDSFQRHRAADKLGDLGNAKAVEPLIVALKDPDSIMRWSAAEALGKIGDNRAVEPLIAALGDSKLAVCYEAAKALRQIGDARAIMPLIIATSGPLDSYEGRALLRDMLSIIDVNAAKQTVPTLVEQLLEALKHTDYKVREQAVDALVTFADERAIKPLITSMLEDSSWPVRQKAAKILKALKYEPADKMQQAIMLMADGKWDSVVELGADAVEPLIATLTLREEKYFWVSDDAAKALGKIGDARAVKPLIAALKDHDHTYTRQAAAYVLGNMADAQAVDPLIAALKDSHQFVREAAASALGKIGGEKAMKSLVLLLEAPAGHGGKIAAEALERAESLELRQAASEYYRRKEEEQKPLTRLWRAEDGSQIEALVNNLSPEETNELVASIDLTNVPLNAFCIDAFDYKGLDDRMVATMHLAYRLLAVGRNAALLSLLDKITAKFDEKLRIGAKRKVPSFESKEPWLIGEDLMMKMHDLAMRLLKKSDPKMDSYAASILGALLLDYPERLESRFWLAATRHNLYMQDKNPDTKAHALKAIDEFLGAAKGHSEYQSNIEALENFRRTEY